VTFRGAAGFVTFTDEEIREAYLVTYRPPSHDLYDQGLAVGSRDAQAGAYRFRWHDEDYTVPEASALVLGRSGGFLTADIAEVRAHATDRVTRAELAQRLMDEVARRHG
jgi:hypothetical protein